MANSINTGSLLLRQIVALLLVTMTTAVQAQVMSAKPFGPLPSENQLRWQEMEMYAFIHYSLNTYTDQEWGFGNEDPKLFNPSNLDCRQWAKVCKQAGMKGIIFTAKHHCGFCMWPSAYTEYSVKNSPWKNGKGDVVRELADACREEGLKFAVYLSPWDRNHKDYGRPEYVTYFRNQLRELLTQYGATNWNDWTKLASGEFSNIVNNPIWQTIKFNPTKVRVLRFEADRLASGERMGYGDIDIK